MNVTAQSGYFYKRRRSGRMLSFAIKQTRKGKDGETTKSFLSCKAFDGEFSQTATSIEKKEDGAPIEVEGELHVDEWESDGKKRTEMYIKVRRWTFPPRDFNDGEVNKSSSERSEDKNWYD